MVNLDEEESALRCPTVSAKFELCLEVLLLLLYRADAPTATSIEEYSMKEETFFLNNGDSLLEQKGDKKTAQEKNV